MSNILIENYRGFDVEFNTTYEKFQCICTDENTKESTSFTAIKKFIDEYKKNNQEFKPFFIQSTPDSYEKKYYKVVGIRKDDRFIVENKKGEKEQLSNYDLGRFMLVVESNENLIKKLSDLEIEIESKRVSDNERRKLIVSEMKIINLKDYKKSLL